MDDQDSELIQAFLEDAAEQLDLLDAHLLRIESGEGPPPQDSEELLAAKRCLHNLKGSAAYMEEATVGELCHSLESLLERPERSAKQFASAVQLTLECVADLRRYAAALSRGESDEACLQGRIAAVQALSAEPAKRRSGPPPGGMAPANDVEDALGPALDRIESACRALVEAVGDLRLAMHRRGEALPDAARTGVVDGIRVLVADDSRTMRSAHRSALASAGFQVALAEDGVDALALLRADRPELVITDLDMPNCTGLELVKAVRADPRLRSLPIIMVTCKGDDAHRAAAMEAGVDAFLVKRRGNRKELLDVIDGVLRTRSESEALPEVQAAAVPPRS